jgi:solute carrier family 39 (zinc transporter), member 1/2/3
MALEETLPLRIGAVFIVLVTSIIGAFLPLVLPRTSEKVYRLICSFATGVILSTGFIHMMPEAFERLSEAFPDTKYPIGAAISMAAVIVTMTMESLATHYFDKLIANSPKESTDIELKPVDVAPSPHPQHGHSHNRVADLVAADISARGWVLAHVLELGIAFHSVIIGVTLGVSSELDETRALLGVIVFHQVFEGFALGAAVLDAQIKSHAHRVLLLLFFAVTTPVGVAIGIGISETYVSSSPTALITEGVFDALSAGVLLHMALVDLAHDAPLSSAFPTAALKAAAMGALTLGAAFMAILGIWA